MAHMIIFQEHLKDIQLAAPKLLRFRIEGFGLALRFRNEGHNYRAL